MQLNWLTDDAKTFLSRGYLRDGQTIEERYGEICKAIKKYSKDVKLANRFKKYIESGWVSFATPVLSNFGSTKNLPISCICKDSWINTPNGGKLIQDIVVGDLVLTHNRKWKPVTNVIVTKDRVDIWELKVAVRKNSLYLTGDHKVYTNKGWCRVDELNIFHHSVAISQENSFVEHRDNDQSIDERFGEEGLIFSPIRRVSEVNKISDVYDLTVQDDHSFSCDGIVVHNCNKSTIDDTLDSILNGAREVGMLSKYGAGTSVNFSNIRPAGSPISSGGTSEGIMPFIEMYDCVISKTVQNSNRRGMMAAYLSVVHPEILSFLEIGSEGNKIQTITTGVTIPPHWMDEMLAGDKIKRKIWSKILKSRGEIGFPYILWEDNVNANKPQVYKDKGYWINHSNLCVSGDQRVVSSQGLKTAKELYLDGSELTLFDGDKPVQASKMYLVEKNAKVYRVTLENGMIHDITDYHKVKARFKGSEESYNKTKMIKCSDLTTDHQVAFQHKKGLFGDTDMPQEAFLMGLWQGDGSASGNNIIVSLWQNDFDLIPELEKTIDHIWGNYDEELLVCNRSGKNNDTVLAKKPNFSNGQVREGSHKRKNIISAAFRNLGLEFDKDKIPSWIWESTEETQWQYLRGLLYSDGTVGCYQSSDKGSPTNLSLSSIRKTFLQEVQILCANLGLKTKIHLLQKGGKKNLPDGNGNMQEYCTKDCFRLTLCNKPDLLEVEKNTQFLSRKGVFLEDRKYRDNTKKFSKVVSVEYIGEQDVFCTKVKTDEHVWACNGIITSNCSEILEYCDIKKTFACCLSSVNVLYYDDWKDDPNFIFDMNLMLDCVLSEYIEKADKLPGLGRAVRFAKEHRAIGLGVLGFHSYLQKNLIPLGSLESFSFNNKLFKYIREESDRASKWMAENWGEPEYMKGTGWRNSSRIAVAPTKSTAQICGGLSLGIEPIKSNYHIKSLAKNQTVYKNPILIDLLESKGKNTKKVWKAILEDNGSVQKLEFLSELEKNVFKTFAEVSQIDLIKLAAQRQQYIDQGQSLNLMFHPSMSAKDIHNIHIEAYKENIKTLYYAYSCNASMEFSRNLLSCSACEG